MNRPILSLAILLAGGMHTYAVSPADSITHHVTELDEFVITTSGSHKIIDLESDGSLNIDARFLHEQPSLLGSNDPISFIKTLPAALTTAELQPGLLIRGSNHGANTFESDGARIANPMHMLGLYSAFNPNFYSSYSFLPGYFPATETNATGGILKAFSKSTPDSVWSGTVNAGLVESNFALHLPLVKKKASLSLGFRKTYINLLFPKILHLGGSTLNYGFTDINAALNIMLPHNSLLKASVFMSRDNMSLHADKNGDVEGVFGWNNLASSLSFRHKNLNLSAAFTLFNNKFSLNEGGRSMRLPSTLSQTTLEGDYRLNSLFFETDVNIRHTSGQCNKALQNPQDRTPSNSFEWNLSAQNDFSLSSKLSLNAGIRLSFYHNSSFNTFYPLPRLRLRYSPEDNLSIYASYCRLARFDRLIEETTGGLPADFWTNADNNVNPEDVNAFEAGATGHIPLIGASFSIDLYYKSIRNSIEFDGAIIELISPSFKPLDHLLDGNGHAYGISAMLSRQFGRLRGRISYNYGRSYLKFPKFGEKYIPASFDRPHDFNASVSWDVTPQLVLSATFTHATGTPYTAAKYGYMIGENLICEYFPHNSSRLPDYNRLDASASWMFLNNGKTKHSLILSVYNALASRNVLFIYTDYSIDKGVRLRKSEMKNVIPSLSYSIEF